MGFSFRIICPNVGAVVVHSGRGPLRPSAAGGPWEGLVTRLGCPVPPGWPQDTTAAASAAVTSPAEGRHQARAPLSLPGGWDTYQASDTAPPSPAWHQLRPVIRSVAQRA